MFYLLSINIFQATPINAHSHSPDQPMMYAAEHLLHKFILIAYFKRAWDAMGKNRVHEKIKMEFQLSFRDNRIDNDSFLNSFINY